MGDAPGAERAHESDDRTFHDIWKADISIGRSDEFHDGDLRGTGVYRDTYHVGNDEKRDQEKNHKGDKCCDVHRFRCPCQELHDVAFLHDLLDAGDGLDAHDDLVSIGRIRQLYGHGIWQICVVIEIIQDRRGITEFLTETVIVLFRGKTVIFLDLLRVGL